MRSGGLASERVCQTGASALRDPPSRPRPTQSRIRSPVFAFATAASRQCGTDGSHHPPSIRRDIRAASHGPALGVGACHPYDSRSRRFYPAGCPSRSGADASFRGHRPDRARVFDPGCPCASDFSKSSRVDDAGRPAAAEKCPVAASARAGFHGPVCRCACAGVGSRSATPAAGSSNPVVALGLNAAGHGHSLRARAPCRFVAPTTSRRIRCP